jgi:hypothetical protein
MACRFLYNRRFLGDNRIASGQSVDILKISGEYGSKATLHHSIAASAALFSLLFLRYAAQNAFFKKPCAVLQSKSFGHFCIASSFDRNAGYCISFPG